MAILPALPNVEVHICVNDIPLEEYQDDDLPEGFKKDQAAKMISRYIESQTDQEFSVRLSVEPPFLFDSPSLVFKVLIDGVTVSVSYFSKREARMRRSIKSIRGSKRYEEEESKTILLPFKFSKIETSPDEGLLDTINKDKQKIAKIGEICVQVFRSGEVTTAPREPGNPKRPNQLSTSNDSKIHEKALKGEAKSHGVSYGDGRPIAPTLRSDRADILDGKDNPLARFVFKYRSKEALKTLLIIKRTPSPDASPVLHQRNSVNLDNLNAEQKRRVQSFVQDLLNGGEASGSSASRIVKRERDKSQGGEPSKKIKLKSEQIDVIDLTED